MCYDWLVVIVTYQVTGRTSASFKRTTLTSAKGTASQLDNGQTVARYHNSRTLTSNAYSELSDDLKRMSTPVRIPKSSSSPISKASSKLSQSRSSSSCSSSHSSPKSAGTSSKDGIHRRHSRPELMSPSLKSQDDYLVYEILSGDSENGLGSVVIIPKSSQGFSWNEGNQPPPGTPPL